MWRGVHSAMSRIRAPDLEVEGWEGGGGWKSWGRAHGTAGGTLIWDVEEVDWDFAWEGTLEGEEEVELRGDDGEEEEGRDEVEEDLPMVRSLEIVDLPLVRRD